MFVAVLVASLVSFGGSSGDDELLMFGEFSVSGRITSSDLEETPADLGDATFAVYFNRDKENDGEITLEVWLLPPHTHRQSRTHPQLTADCQRQER